MQRLQAAHEELRSVQLQLIEAEKMKSIGRLSAGIAHEVKNPLAILRMAIDYLNTIKSKDENAPVILKERADAGQREAQGVGGLAGFRGPPGA